MRFSDPPIALRMHAHILQFVNTVLATFIAKLRLAVVFSVQSVMLVWLLLFGVSSTFSIPASFLSVLPYIFAHSLYCLRQGLV